MDEDLKLIEHLRQNSGVSALGRLMGHAATTITRLRAEIEALKSDVSDLVRAGSDEATENERLREALRPFAALGATYLTERQRIHVPDDEPTQPTVFLVGEVRAASRTLEGGPG